MPDITMNIAKGRVGEFFKRVVDNDPTNAAFVLIPVETSGLESDATLKDKATVSDWFSGTTNEQTTMGRKTLTNVELTAMPAPDNTNDRYSFSFPAVTWVSAGGNAISGILVAFDYDTTAGSDADMVPCTFIAASATPNGTNLTLNANEFYRAS